MDTTITPRDLVSIIMPTHNCAKYIETSIKSVLAQSYVNWELLIIDDCSTDNTEEIVRDYVELDSRICYFKQAVNYGAAMARNKAMELAKGKYIAYLDSDDLWTKDKLTKQIYFMKENGYKFTCTAHDHIDEDGKLLDVLVGVNPRADYNRVLLMCPIGNSTVIYDAEALGKFYIPNIKKSNDYLLWLQILKKEKYIFGLNENLGSWRRLRNSLSSNKVSMVKYHWQIYREFEKLSIVRSVFLIAFWGLIKIFHIKK